MSLCKNKDRDIWCKDKRVPRTKILGFIPFDRVCLEYEGKRCPYKEILPSPPPPLPISLYGQRRRIGFKIGEE